MIVLRDGATLARVDPRHGAEVVDLVDLRTGRQLLGRPPFGSEPPLGGELDEQSWSERWRGGWQTCFPSFGMANTLGDVRHGFHGRASNDPWELLHAGAAGAALRWTGHGLRATKRFTAGSEDAGCELRVETTLEAERDDVPAIALEHLALGLELIEPEVELELPAGAASQLDDELGPAVPPDDAPAWPEIRMVDGSVERGGRWALGDPRSLLFVVRELAEGRARVTNSARGQSVELAWDAERLPHVVVWYEARASGGLWREQAEALCIEPCSVPHEAGLAAAVESGGAWRLAAGERVSWWVTLRSCP